MKKYISILFFAMAVPLVIACSDYLDKRPDDQLDIEKAFENSKNLDRWLAYIYSGMPKYYADSNWDAIADDMITPSEWIAVGNRVCLYQEGSWDATDPNIISFWYDLPKRIRSAYLFIQKAHPLTDVSQKDIDIMKAECRFFIAYYQSLLVMTYGSVPLITEAAATTNAQDLMLKQRPFYEVVDWCANELLAVSSQLPVTYTDQANDYGRATSLWALAMRARLLTFAASPLVNGNTAMASTVNCDGEKIFQDTFDPYRWKAAADANRLLIDTAEANGYELYVADPVDGEHDPYMSYFGAVMLRKNQGNNEIIMVRTDDDGSWIDRKSAPRSIQSQSGVIGVSQKLVDAFFMANGKVAIEGYNGKDPLINDDSGYTETGFSQNAMTAKTRYFYNDPDGLEGRTENIITTAGTFNMYCNREPRFYISVMYNESFNWAKTHKDNTEANPSDKKYADFFFGGEDGKDGTDYPPAGYLMKKRVAPDYLGSSSAGQYKLRNGIIYRLAEAYLAYAESLYEYSVAVGEYDACKQEIFKYINMIRHRAGIPEYGSASLPEPSQEDMRELIRRERRVELNCESGLRWNDLRRWKEAETVLDGDFYGMNMMATAKEDFYVRTQYQKRKFLSYWWPIPQDDIDRNTNLRQLPGW